MSEPSPETHVYVGMFRPPFAQALREAMDGDSSGWIEGQRIYYWHGGAGVDKCREAWLFGHFDEPVYKTIEEVVRMRDGGERR